ncbi:hypothetical protein APHAL10511_007418 [Amanita phalloides]|nr:hypothetical protein APHAL10511_007418 [Amanita phalloides]
MSSNNNIQSSPKVQHSDPIPIVSRLGRGRSVSLSSSGSSSAFDIQTPVSSSSNSQHVSVPSPTGSPILSYFLGQSPTKVATNATFPFKRCFAPPTVLEDEELEKSLPVAAHMRRTSLNVSGRFGQPQASGPIPDSQMDRATGFLRRLSLGGSTFNKFDNISPTSPAGPPSPPPNTGTSPTIKSPPATPSTRLKRSSTVGENGRTRRAPSPMGERILKGHFDGFN